MKHPTNANLIRLIMAGAVILGVSVGCSNLKRLGVVNSQSDKVNKFNYDIPFGSKSADLDAESQSQAAFIIAIPDSNQIMLQSVEAGPINFQQLDEKLEAFAAGKSHAEKTAYIAAGHEVEWSTIANVLSELHKYEIANVKLVVSNEPRRKDSKGNTGEYDKSMGDIPAPDHIFEVKIGEQLAPIYTSAQINTISDNVPKMISGGVLNGKAISLPKPEYPVAARAVRASGAVNVQVVVDMQGNVISASAVSGHPLLRAAAVQAARQAKFASTMLSGKPVKVSGVIVYSFVP